ncbi:MAG: ABC transporter ATP-binding protein [Lachnospiraceae bacterium]|jgi:ATP-binding cassette subfamily B multidrug efflux pump|nr:ABC transporter ATP-binding protein [Lachnospiraceae bacterium]
MSLFHKKEEEQSDINYEGSAILRMLSYMRPYLGAMAVCFLLVLIITALELYKPMLIGDAIDRYITGDFAAGEMAKERFTGILTAAVKYLGVLGALFVCSRYQYLLLQTTGQKIIYEIRNELFVHVESLSMRFFDLTPVGKIVTRITNDVEALNDLYSNILVRLFRNVVKIAGLAVVMLTLNVQMALYSLVMVPLIILLTIVFKNISRRAYQLTKTRVTALNTFLSENISGMKVIQIFNREKEKYKEFCDKSDSLYRANFREMMVFAIFRPCIELTSVAAMVIIITGGGKGVLEGTLSLGTMYIFMQYIRTFFEPIQDLAEQLSTLQSAIASAEKIFTLLDEKPLIRDREEPVILPQIRGRIEFKHVWFAYNGEDYILKDVSFVIEPGQKVAFVGATGAGKSSILNLIGRYYDIQKGEILIDGVDIRQMSRDQIRSAIGQVQQDVFIFTGDIGSNIRLRNEDISDETIREAARQVNASHFIERLPDGYGEKVSERGATFSSGQRQLLSFARTLAFDPTILILDEATANIDTETEQWIQGALETLMRGRTTIMVAHRLSTIQHADKIIVMHGGRIRESGTHQELLDQGGIYHKLYQLQLA